MLPQIFFTNFVCTKSESIQPQISEQFLREGHEGDSNKSLNELKIIIFSSKKFFLVSKTNHCFEQCEEMRFSSLKRDDFSSQFRRNLAEQVPPM